MWSLKKPSYQLLKKTIQFHYIFFQASYPCLQRDYWYVHVLCFPSKPCNQSDIYYLKSRLHHIFKKRKKKDLSCQDCFFIQDNNPQDSNCECSDNVSIYTNLLREINMTPTLSNNMNCCWWHVNRMEWNIKYIYTCIYNYV